MTTQPTTEERAALVERARWHIRGGIAREVNNILVWVTVPLGIAAQPGDPVSEEHLRYGTPANNAALLLHYADAPEHFD